MSLALSTMCSVLWEITATSPTERQAPGELSRKGYTARLSCHSCLSWMREGALREASIMATLPLANMPSWLFRSMETL